jgi:ribosomal protein L20A (L18A)
MNKSSKRIRITKKRRGGKKNCKTKCKSKFLKEVQQDKRYKALNKMASYFVSKKVVESELNKVLDSKDIQDDKVFKECIKDCKK